MENLSIVGIGRLGLCFALGLEEVGYNVIGVDINQEYVDKINNKEFESIEPNVEKLLRQSKNFKATTSLKEAVERSNLLFLVVATNTLEDGHYDHSQLDSVVNKLLDISKPEQLKHVIVVSTVIPGYCNSIKEKLWDHNYSVSYNPEFIAQGSIIKDQTSPDMILIGEANPHVGNLIENVYMTMCDNQPLCHRMDPLSAEITKLALNCFLATKISYANMVGDLAIQAGANPDKILNAVGSDSRIGKKFLRYGFGYGGPCIPRDGRAFATYAKDIAFDAKIPIVADDVNKQHLEFQIQEFIKNHPLASSQEQGTWIELRGQVTYKPGTDIIEESQQLAYAVGLAQAGYKIRIIDSLIVINKVKKQYGSLFEYEII